MSHFTFSRKVLELLYSSVPIDRGTPSYFFLNFPYNLIRYGGYIWNHTNLVVLNFCLEGLHHVTIYFSMEKYLYIHTFFRWRSRANWVGTIKVPIKVLYIAARIFFSVMGGRMDKRSFGLNCGRSLEFKLVHLIGAFN